MAFDLLDEVFESITNRKIWEQRYRTWTQMRYDGIPRKNRPWNGAANQHSHIADDEITKLKPFYIEEVYASELLGYFTPKDPQTDLSLTVAAEQAFTYKMGKSNFEREYILTIDRSLNYGQAILKTFYNEQKKRLEFQMVEAIDFFVPPYTKDIQDSPWCVEQIEIPYAMYKENPYFNQSKDFVEKIRGDQQNPYQDDSNDLLKKLREGINYQQNERNVIIMWQTWRQSDGKWFKSVWSPFDNVTPIKDEVPNPYDHGLAPYTEWPYELTSHGFYSPRGVCEITSSEETQANKAENMKMDMFDLTLVPMFKSSVGNTNNVRMLPGQILSGDINPIPMSPPPIDLNQEVQYLRQRASQRVGQPDLGMGNQDGDAANPMTAFQTSVLNNVNNKGTGLRARINKLALTKVYHQAWSLMVQYESDDLNYFYRRQSQKLDPKVYTLSWDIQPASPANGETKETRFQKTLGFYQLSLQSQFANQEENYKMLVEAYDPSKMDRIFVPQGGNDLAQSELQNMEILLMLSGKKAVLKPSDKDEVHIQTIIDDLVGKWQQGHSLIPFYHIYEPHLLEHMERLRVQKPDRMYNFYKKRINELVRMDAKMIKDSKKNLAFQSQEQTNTPSGPTQ